MSTVEDVRAPAREAAATALNPHAMAFLPWWRVGGSRKPLSADAPEFVVRAAAGDGNAGVVRVGRRRAPHTRRLDARGPSYAYKLRRAQRQQAVNKTIFIRDIDYTVTKEILVILFGHCGTVVDCRSCGNPTSELRSAFIEFEDESEAYASLSFDGAIIGVCPLKVSLSRSAIIPVNHMFLPRSEAERKRSLRTIYCSNISKAVNEWDLRALFEGYFGEISCIKLLDNHKHATNIAFIEFSEVHCAVAALQSSCIYAGGLHIRVSLSKTPIRP